MNKIKKFQTFSFNGENYLSSGSKFTVFDLINYFDYSPALLAVEYNKLILIKKDWKQTIILDNDEIEILTIVGGGLYSENLSISFSERKAIFFAIFLHKSHKSIPILITFHYINRYKRIWFSINKIRANITCF